MKRIFYILSAIAAFALLSCHTEAEQADYLALDVEHYTFTKDTSSLAVKVNANVTWEPVSESDWVTVENVTEEGFVVRVEENTGKENRSAVVVVNGEGLSKELKIEQFGNSFTGVFMDLLAANNAIMSPRGKRIFYMDRAIQSGNDWWYTPRIINVETNEVISLDPQQEYDVAQAISDDGNVLVMDWGGGGRPSAVFVNGEKVDLVVPDGYIQPSVSNISSDGSVMVGYIKQNVSRGKYFPVKWTNGEPEILPSPEMSPTGTDWNGCMARGCSADGEVIYGSHWDAMTLVYWKDGMLFDPGTDYAEKIEIVYDDSYSEKYYSLVGMSAENTKISVDGRYISAVYTDYDYNNEQLTVSSYPAIFDTETHQPIFVKGFEGTGMVVSPQGDFFAASPAQGIRSGHIIDPEGGNHQDISDWFMERFGIVMTNDRIVYSVSEDGNAFLGRRPMDTPFGTVYPYWYMKVK